MDDFERFLFGRIADLENRLIENEGHCNPLFKNEVAYHLNGLIEELLEVLSNYNLKYKTY